MTIVMFFFGVDFTKQLGSLLGMEDSSAYFIGGSIHLLVGIIYGFLYGLIFEPLLHKLPGFLSGALYSLLPFVISMVFFGTFINILQDIFNVETAEGTKASYKAVCGWSEDTKNSDTEQSPTGKSQPLLDVDPDSENNGQDQFEQKLDEENQSNDQLHGDDDNQPAYSTTGCGCNGGDYSKNHRQKNTPQNQSPQELKEKKQWQNRSQEDVENQAIPEDLQGSSQGAAAKNHSTSSTSQNVKKDQSTSHASKKQRNDAKNHDWVWSLVSHLVYGVVLGIVYRPRKSSQSNTE